MNMTWNDYQKNMLKLLSPQTTQTKQSQLINAVMGLAGESGEANDLVKKYLYHSHDFDRERFKKELGDILFYLSSAADAIDCTLEEVAHANVAKLTKRYPNGFTVEDSIAKRDQLETTTVTSNVENIKATQ